MFVVFSLAVFVTFASSDNCVPGKTGFHWSSPCEGQTFNNVFTIENVTQLQKNEPFDRIVDGIDFTKDFVIAITVKKNHDRVIIDPLIDLSRHAYRFSEIDNECEWSVIDTFETMKNLNACDLMNNCHMFSASKKEFNVTINIPQLNGDVSEHFQHGAYFRLWVTFKDGKKNRVACLNVQHQFISTTLTRQKRGTNTLKKVQEKMMKWVQCYAQIKSLYKDINCTIKQLGGARFKCQACVEKMYDCTKGAVNFGAKLTSCVQKRNTKCENCCEQFKNSLSKCQKTVEKVTHRTTTGKKQRKTSDGNVLYFSYWLLSFVCFSFLKVT